MSDDDRTPLHWAASEGDLVKVKELIAQNVDLDATDELNWTPLMIAVSGGKYDIAKMLIENHADLNISNSNGQIALHYASSKNMIPMLKLLIENGSDLNTRDKYVYQGMTPLHRSVSKGNIGITKELLSTKKVNLNAADIEGNTPLHLAADEERILEFKLLVKNGADFKVQNKAKKTPLELLKSGQLMKTLKEFCENPISDEDN